LWSSASSTHTHTTAHQHAGTKVFPVNCDSNLKQGSAQEKSRRLGGRADVGTKRRAGLAGDGARAVLAAGVGAVAADLAGKTAGGAKTADTGTDLAVGVGGAGSHQALTDGVVLARLGGRGHHWGAGRGVASAGDADREWQVGGHGDEPGVTLAACV